MSLVSSYRALCNNHHHTAAMPDYKSPILPDKEIISNLDNYGVDPGDSKAALALDPTAFQSVLETLMLNVAHFESDWLKPCNAYSDVIEHPEIYDDSLRDFNLVYCVKDVLNSIGITNFRWKDIHKPNSKTVRLWLCALINFAKFCEWQEGVETQVEEEIEKETANNDEIRASLDVARKEYDVVCSENEDKEARIVELADIHADEEAKLEALSRDYENVNAARQEWTEEAAHTKQQLHIMEAKRAEACQALADLRVNLCDDQVEIVAQLAEARKSTEALKEERYKLSDKKAEVIKWGLARDTLLQQLMNTIDLLHNTMARKDEVKAMKLEHAKEEKAIEDAEYHVKILLGKKDTQEKALRRVTEQWQEDRERLQAATDKANQVLEMAKISAQSRAERSESIRSKTSALNYKAAEDESSRHELSNDKQERVKEKRQWYSKVAASVAWMAGALEKRIVTDSTEDQENRAQPNGAAVEPSAELKRKLQLLSETVRQLQRLAEGYRCTFAETA